MSSLQNCQEGRPLCSGQTGTNSGVCVLWGHQPTHMAASSHLCSKACQSASSVRLRGPSVSLASGQGVGDSRPPGGQAREAVLPGPALPASAPARSGLPPSQSCRLWSSRDQLANDGERLLQGLHKSCHSVLKDFVTAAPHFLGLL